MEKQKNRKAIIYVVDDKAGILEETGNGYKWTYEKEFINKKVPISLSLPLKKEPYESSELFSFFLGLLPEGWYLDIISSTLKIDKKDYFGLLIATCEETIGAISIEKIL